MNLPRLPTPRPDGNLDARAYMGASIAPGIIQDRVRLGWSREELARNAGIRLELLAQIEDAERSPSVPTMKKIDKAVSSGNLGQETKRRSAPGRR